MRTRRPLPRYAATLVALVAVSAALAGCGGGSDPGKEPVDARAYAALGDSYSSGAGITPVDDLACYRSEQDYPKLLAAKLDLQVDDVTCGGAETTNLSERQTQGGGVNPPQLDAVDAQTSLVTLGIGLNDKGLAYVLSYACLPSAGAKATCDAYLKLPYSDVQEAITAAVARVGSALDEIKSRAPEAQVVLVGYPRGLPETGSCPAKLPLPQAALDRGRRAAADIEAAYKQVAADEKVTYLSTYDASEGHDICSADPWVNGIKGAGSLGASLHPTLTYHQAVAGMLAPLVKK
ncbi:SGNH/GDSL hydrolase family protein [Marmoricola sp. RAF53]|uniref:SGNH/GDSL hydrolase family protein n=1 Tax=Marmoricola sp. RAF53 TaxID=3233059 RepID=UPI003F966557